MPPKSKPRPNKNQNVAPKPGDVYVRIDDLSKVASLCQVGIQKATGIPWVRFKPVSADRSRKNLMELSGKGTTQAIADGQEHVVVPLLDRYWVAAKLEFDNEPNVKKLCLISVQLFIFQSSLASEVVKVPLLRIEWDCRRGYLLDKHAQPHWHVYNSLVNATVDHVEATDFDEESPVLEIEPPLGDVIDLPATQTGGQSALPQGHRFHFALAADWQKPVTDPPRQNHELILAELGNWIEWCLTYTKGQLKHVLKHTSGKIQP